MAKAHCFKGAAYVFSKAFLTVKTTRTKRSKTEGLMYESDNYGHGY